MKLGKPKVMCVDEAQKSILRIMLAETMPSAACKIVSESIPNSVAIQMGGAGTRILLLI